MRAIRLIKKPRRRGFIFLTAIISLVVMILVGTAFLAMAMQQMGDVRRDLAAVRALATADAGLNYVVWLQRYSQYDSDYTVMPIVYFPATRVLPASLNGDACRITITNVTPGYEVISQGVYNDNKPGKYIRTVRAMMHPPTPLPPGVTDNLLPPIFDYALFSATNLDLNGNTTVVGDVGCNQGLTISGTPQITGDLTVGGSITGNGSSSDVTGDVLPNQDPVLFPPLELYKYLAKANQSGIVSEGNLQLSGGTVDFSNRVVYVKGQLQITSSTRIIGPVTIIAEGGVVVNAGTATTSVNTNGNASVTDIVIMTPGDVTFQGSATLDAVIYAHNMDANFGGRGTATIHGAVIADGISSRGTFDIYYRRPSIDNIIFFPGSTTVGLLEWTVASWQLLN